MKKNTREEDNLTCEELNRLLIYDPLTGVFTNRVTRNSRAVKGTRAGNLDHTGYRTIAVDYKSYREHRLAFLYMGCKVPPCV